MVFFARKQRIAEGDIYSFFPMNAVHIEWWDSTWTMLYTVHCTLYSLVYSDWSTYAIQGISRHIEFTWWRSQDPIVGRSYFQELFQIGHRTKFISMEACGCFFKKSKRNGNSSAKRFVLQHRLKLVFYNRIFKEQPQASILINFVLWPI